MPESTPRSGSKVARAAVVTHGKPGTIGDAARPPRSAPRRRRASSSSTPTETPDVAIVLGGDGTMLRALRTFLGTRRARVRRQLRPRRLPDERRRGRSSRAASRASSPATTASVELATLRVDVGGESHPAINDVVATSARLGRMVELGWEIGGEDLGVQPCDGMICSTPAGSTAYNLSNGGPVLMWGLDAMAITFVAPHSLHARPLVVPRGPDAADHEPTRGRRRSRCSPTATRSASSSPTARARGGHRRRAEPARAAPRGDVLRPLQRGVLVALRSLRIENLVLIREAELSASRRA